MRPVEQIDNLFDYYVGRNFTHLELQETKMEKCVKEAFARFNVGRKFVSQNIGGEVRGVRLPFVAKGEGRITHMIKPFFLGQKNPAAIVDHGWAWKGKIERIRDDLPIDVLFAVKGPEQATLNKRKAYGEAIEYLKDTPKIALMENFTPEQLVDYAMN